MFTLLPSLYIVAVHYLRNWNTPYYYEEETSTSAADPVVVVVAAAAAADERQTSTDIAARESIPKCDKPLLPHADDFVITHERSPRSSLVKINGYSSVVPHDEDEPLTKVKPRTKMPPRSSSLLNAERQKTYTSDLSEDDLIHLMNETGFTREQILLWHTEFLRDCPDGRLSKAKFIDIYKQFYKKGQVVKFCEHAFRVFDKDGSGCIDFVEFLIAVSMTSTKDPVRKTELFFSMYDIDRNGLIDENEMRCVVESIYELMGIDVHDSTRIDMKVQEIFAKAECDQSGYLTKDQFALACKNDRHIRKLLVPNTKAPAHR